MFLHPATTSGRQVRQRAIARSLPTVYDPVTMIDRITATYYRATDDAEQAIDWYRTAHALCQDYARAYEVPFTVAAGVMAVLSPSTGWARNVQLTGDMLETGDCSHAYGNAIEQARRIIAGESLHAVVKVGRKVKSFYACIIDPDNKGAVCIDRHAIVLATGTPIGELDKYLERPAAYVMAQAAYRTAARQLNLLPSELQAITWTQHRIETGADRHDTVTF